MIRYLGRVAARRVVWIVVGIATLAVLNAAGVRAADPTPDPSLAPILVSLVDLDRERLDLLTFSVVIVGGLSLLALGASILAAFKR